MPWTWNPGLFDRVNDDGVPMGRADLNARSTRMVASSTNELIDIALRTKTGGLPLPTGRDALRQELKEEYIRQYLLGIGGRGNMTPTDWGSVGGSLVEQYRYLDRNVIPYLDTMTEGQIRNRMAMYANSAREAFYRAQARARGFDPNYLPYLPADGDTICLTRCKCQWDFHPVYDDDETLIGWDCYWILSGGDSCDTCIGRQSESSPFRIRF